MLFRSFVLHGFRQSARTWVLGFAVLLAQVYSALVTDGFAGLRSARMAGPCETAIPSRRPQVASEVSEPS